MSHIGINYRRLSNEIFQTSYLVSQGTDILEIRGSIELMNTIIILSSKNEEQKHSKFFIFTFFDKEKNYHKNEFDSSEKKG